MSKTSFQIYGILAGRDLSYTEIAGRYSIQQADERRIVLDVVSKLELSPDDDLLEIGCGPGNLLIPLSFLVNTATGVDHPNVLKRLATRSDNESIERIAGSFLDLNIEKEFSKVLVYGMLHYLSDEDEVISFLDKAVSLLKPGGILLLGDIPNIDKKRRFLSTRHGRNFEQQWRRKMANCTPPWNDLGEDGKLVEFNDDLVMRILLHFRKLGLHTYVVRQPVDLPFGFTREDIIIERLEA